MAQHTLSTEELERLTNKIAADVLESVSRALRLGSFGGPGHFCNGIEFNCTDEYTCVKPDGCAIKFDCAQTYNRPK